MANTLVYLILVLFSSHPSVWATRFLPMIIWDHLNPLLSCKCNWLVIPYVDVYDQQQFTCPTKDIYANLLDGYTRPDDERNENIFRRRWPGTKDDLKNMIRNGSIHSFCDPTSSDTSKLYVCEGGKYRSHEVTYNYDIDPSRNYIKDNIYVFFNNGHNGKLPTLKSNEAKCTMFFAVSVTSGKKTLYGVNFGKPALTGSRNCKLSTCPPLKKNSSLLASPAAAVLTRFKTLTDTERLSSIPAATLTTRSTTTTAETLQTTSFKKHGPELTAVSSTRTTASRIPQKPVTRRPKNPVPCKDVWLNNTILAVFTVVAFIVGVVLTVFGFAVRKALDNRRAPVGESLTLENTYRSNGGNVEEVGSPTSGSPWTERQHITRGNDFGHKV